LLEGAAERRFSGWTGGDRGTDGTFPATSWASKAECFLPAAPASREWSKQVTDGQTFTFDDPATPGVDDGYAYASGGRLTKMFYPSGRPVSYQYDIAGRPKSAGGYVTSLNYAAHGAPEHIVPGNGVEETTALSCSARTLGPGSRAMTSLPGRAATARGTTR
jgi:hypothetical protein